MASVGYTFPSFSKIVRSLQLVCTSHFSFCFRAAPSSEANFSSPADGWGNFPDLGFFRFGWSSWEKQCSVQLEWGSWTTFCYRHFFSRRATLLSMKACKNPSHTCLWCSFLRFSGVSHTQIKVMFRCPRFAQAELAGCEFIFSCCDCPLRDPQDFALKRIPSWGTNSLVGESGSFLEEFQDSSPAFWGWGVIWVCQSTSAVFQQYQGCHWWFRSVLPWGKYGWPSRRIWVCWLFPPNF